MVQECLQVEVHAQSCHLKSSKLECYTKPLGTLKRQLKVEGLFRLLESGQAGEYVRAIG